MAKIRGWEKTLLEIMVQVKPPTGYEYVFDFDQVWVPMFVTCMTSHQSTGTMRQQTGCSLADKQTALVVDENL